LKNWIYSPGGPLDNRLFIAWFGSGVPSAKAARRVFHGCKVFFTYQTRV